MSINSNPVGILKKVFAGMTIATTVLSLSGFAVIAPALAAAPADYGLQEGNTVSAAGSDDPDVYIINELGYKRLFLNPVIFGFYGHLGGFANVKSITPATRDAFPTSGLFQNCETGDAKVYGVETTGEDTGILHWVNTTGAQAVADDANFFKKVFCINNNEFNWYAKGSDYTSVNQVPSYARTPGTTTTPGAIVVSLSPSTPSATTVTTNAQGVEFLRVKLTGTGTISNLTIKRTGAGAVGDFDNVYLYEGARRLTTGKSLSSANGDATFSSIDSGKGIVVSGSKEISVVGDLSASAGNVNAFEMTAITLSSGTASGLPIRGNNITVSGAASGGITVTKVGSIPNPNVGAKQAQITEFKLTANTEAASVKRMTMIQGGTLKPADFANIKLKAGTSEWGGTIDSAGYVTVDMGSGYTIVKGGEAVFKMYADVSGKSAEDINLYFESITDILAIGDQYGFGMAVTNTDNTGLYEAADAHDVTLQGGVLTISQDTTLTASNIGTDTNDTTLLRYSITAATNIEIRATEFTLCWDQSGGGSYVDADDTTYGWADLEDFKVTDIDSGVIIIGPQDGSAFTTEDADGGSCEDSADGAQKNFTDTYELMAGKTYNFKVTGDIKIGTAGGAENGIDIEAADAIQVILDNWVDDTPSVTIMKYAGTTTAVADADIVPAADIAGPAMTLQSSSLALGLSSVVNDQTIVRGTQDVSAVGITFQAAQASDLKVTDIVLTGYASDAGTTGIAGVSGTAVVGSLVSAVKLYEAESGALLSANPAASQLSNTTGTITFNNLNWNIPAGATKTLLVKVNLGTNAVDSDGEWFYFDVNATTDVTALDSSSKTVNAGNSDPNGTTTVANAVYVKVTNSGTLAAAVNTSSTPIDHAVFWGQTGDVAGVWRFTSADEGQYLETLQFGEDDTNGTQETDFATNAKMLYLTYKNKVGQTLTVSAPPSSAGTASWGFSGDSRPYVPKDGSLDVTLKVDYKTKSEGATSGKVWDLAFLCATGGSTQTFKAIGEGSGIIVDGGDTGFASNVDLADAASGASNTRIYRVFPEFTAIAPTSTKLTTNDPVLIFTITAKGLSDSRLFFDNENASSGSIKFEVVASGVGTTADPAFTVKDDVSAIYDTGTITNATVTSPAASLTFDFGSKDAEITGGTSKTFKIYLDTVTDFNTPLNTTAGVGADYFQLVLRDDEAGLINWVDNSTNDTNDADTASTAGYLRNLPMAGYQFTAQ